MPSKAQRKAVNQNAAATIVFLENKIEKLENKIASGLSSRIAEYDRKEAALVAAFQEKTERLERENLEMRTDYAEAVTSLLNRAQSVLDRSLDRERQLDKCIELFKAINPDVIDVNNNEEKQDMAIYPNGGGGDTDDQLEPIKPGKVTVVDEDEQPITEDLHQGDQRGGGQEETAVPVQG
jgi:hypothetical protein